MGFFRYLLPSHLTDAYNNPLPNHSAVHAGTSISRRHLILQNDIEGVDNAGDVSRDWLSARSRRRRCLLLVAGYLPKDGEQNVDEKVGTAAALKEDSERREDDGKDDLADVAVMKS